MRVVVGVVTALALVVALAGAPSVRAEVVEVGRAAAFEGRIALDGSRVLAVAAGGSRRGESVRVFGDPGWPRADELLKEGDGRDLQLTAGGGRVAAGRWESDAEVTQSELVVGPAGGPFRVLERCRGEAAFGPPDTDFGTPPPVVAGQTVAWLACGKRQDRVLVVDGGLRRTVPAGGTVRSIALAGRLLVLGVLERDRRARRVVRLIDLDARVPGRRVVLPGRSSDLAVAVQADGTAAVAAGSNGEGVMCPQTGVWIISPGATTARKLELAGCGPLIALAAGRVVLPRAQAEIRAEPDLVVAPIDGGAPTVIDRGSDEYSSSRFAVDGARVAWIHDGCTSQVILAAPLDALPGDQRETCPVEILGARLTSSNRLAVRIACPRGCQSGSVVAVLRDPTHIPTAELLRRPGHQTVRLRLSRRQARALRRAKRPRVKLLLELGVPAPPATERPHRVTVEIAKRGARDRP